MRQILLIFFVFLCFSNTQAQDWALERSVQVTADVESSPGTIHLNWVSQPAWNFQLYRRVKGTASWGFVIATVDYPTNTYEDTNVDAGVSYEYRIVKNAPIKGEGSINAGFEIEAVEQRGKMILVVDETHATALSTGIEQLINDIRGDGWAVERFDVSPTDAVTDVKANIVDIYEADSDNVKAVLLLGHIPVPYSGELYPDGHEDHQGAWPADVYYGDMNGVWTDQSINNSLGTQSRHHNVPSDGKYDQSFIPSDIELQVGRIDFHNLPAFADDEMTLLQNYLNKNHEFRHKEFTMPYRGLLENNFAGLPEGFAQSAYRNFTNMFGADEIYEEDYTTLNTDAYLWSYGCGGGSYTSCSGVTTTADLAANPLQTVFAMLFGSYFGDWDSQDNLLRSALASGSTLTNVWAGRPKFQFQHMALGENIGYGVLLSQNTATDWVQDTTYGGRLIHIALMGDPSLRMHVVAPITDMTAVEDNANAMLSWTASTDDVMGYHVYRKVAGDDYFERLNEELVTATTYTDPCLNFQTEYEYMVRAMKLENSASGSYYNLSQGIMANVTIQTNMLISADFTWLENGHVIEFDNNSTNGTTYLWDFGDGETSTEEDPSHIYQTVGIYDVTLTISNDCFTNTVSSEVDVIIGSIESVLPGVSLEINPIPADEYIDVILTTETASSYQLSLMSVTGKVLLETTIDVGLTSRLDVAHLPGGLYLLQIEDAKGNVGSSKLLLK